MERRRFIIGIGTASTIALAGCSEEGEVTTEGNGDGNGDGNGGGNDETVIVHEQELTEDALGDAVVEGEATNELGSEETIHMEATFYNSEGTILDDGLSDRNEDIPNGQRFQFEIISTVEYAEVGDYDIEYSTGF